MAGILSCGHKPQGELHLAFPSDCERRGASLTHCRASEAVWPDNGGRWHYPRTAPGRMPGIAGSQRSEEHTSKLQSQSNLVCRLLLEKKKEMHRIALSRETHAQR